MAKEVQINDWKWRKFKYRNHILYEIENGLYIGVTRNRGLKSDMLIAECSFSNFIQHFNKGRCITWNFWPAISHISSETQQPWHNQLKDRSNLSFKKPWPLRLIKLHMRGATLTSLDSENSKCKYIIAALRQSILSNIICMPAYSKRPAMAQDSTKHIHTHQSNLCP